jgi:N-methylhydantoinase B
MEGYPVENGDVFYQVLPGAGGYGHPFDRPLDRVREDVIDRKITVDYARTMYGVAIAQDGTVDEAATAKLRAARPALNGKAHLPLFFRAMDTFVEGFADCIADKTPGAS